MSPEPQEPATMEPGGIKPELQRSEDLSSSKDSAIDAVVANTRYASTKAWLAGFVAFVGTGLMAVVSYLDPGNLEADIQIGVGAGFSLLWWTAICCLVFGFVFQCLAGRVGLISGTDLAQQLGSRYPKHARILTWILIEIAIIGADIQETIGSAVGIAILTNGKVPLWAGCIIVSCTAFALLLLERWGFRQLEAIFAAFIAVESICMGINFFQAPIAAEDVVKGIFIPRLNSNTTPLAVASLGALVMPYNIYFQSFIVNMHPHNLTTDARKRTVLTYLRVENFLVLLFAFIINMFVICVFADGFYGVLTEDDVGMESAGDHLAERFGDVFRTLWAIGLLASGQIATIGLTYAGQIVMSGLLNLRVHAGARMMATRLVALIPTVTLAVVFESTGTFDRVAQTLNIVQSILLPFALIPVVHVAADFKVLGKYRSHPALTVFAGIIAAIVSGVNGWILVDYMHTEFPDSNGAVAGFSVFIACYYALVIYYAVGPENVPDLLRHAVNGVSKAVAFVRANTRCRADPGALLEVHH